MTMLERDQRSWTDRAACKGQTDLFFSEDPTLVAAAQEICRHCTVIAECDASRPATTEGVWAGHAPLTVRGARAECKTAILRVLSGAPGEWLTSTDVRHRLPLPYPAKSVHAGLLNLHKAGRIDRADPDSASSRANRQFLYRYKETP